ncbi:MAG: alginate lyase family protein [Acidobacteriota bacterium]
MKRSPQEIAFRLRQEAANLWLAFGSAPPAPDPSPLPFPRPEAFLPELRNSPYENSLIAVAEGVLQRRFPLLGTTLHTQREIRWRRDYGSGKETGLDYFRRIPYLDPERAGDHKVVWELNRHQHLVALAQAHLLTGRSDFLDDLWIQLESWLDQNPFCRGMNWTSALEVAFRALSWLWIEHLVGSQMPKPLRRRWLAMLFQHGRYLEYNLSVYFAPNTHLQGEAVALHALGLLFQKNSASIRWRQTGSTLLEQIIQTHVRPDGGHFEQSSYYHVYATDMFLFHAQLQQVSPSYLARLRKMVGYLWALASPGNIPFLGDDDGGRFFSPYGPRREFSRATLTACAQFFHDTPWNGDPSAFNELAVWWLGKRESIPAKPAVSMLFPDTGVAVLCEADVHVVADTRGFGFGGAGHSHAHALHFTLRRGGVDVLIDPGTYTYVADPVLRNNFRGTAAHNTVRVDRLDQATPAGPFRWNNLPETELLHWSEQPWRLHAVCRYRGVAHHREMVWSGGVLFVLDRLEGQGSHQLEQFWHPAGDIQQHSPAILELPAKVFLCLPLPQDRDTSSLHIEDGGDFGWYSSAPGSREGRPVIRVDLHSSLPCKIAAAFVFGPGIEPAPLTVNVAPDGVRLECGGRHADFV